MATIAAGVGSSHIQLQASSNLQATRYVCVNPSLGSGTPTSHLRQHTYHINRSRLVFASIHCVRSPRLSKLIQLCRGGLRLQDNRHSLYRKPTAFYHHLRCQSTKCSCVVAGFGFRTIGKACIAKHTITTLNHNPRSQPFNRSCVVAGYGFRTIGTACIAKHTITTLDHNPRCQLFNRSCAVAGYSFRTIGTACVESNLLWLLVSSCLLYTSPSPRD